MNEHRDLLERVGERFAFPDQAFERMLRRRDRKRRNQRITAGVVGIAVFVASVWIVTTGGPADRTRTPGGATGPTVAPDYPGRVGLVGLAPEGATPSTPEHGELVVGFAVGHSGGDPGRFSLHLYEDGRLIWEKLGVGYAGGDPTPTGLIEQRLTPEGVELVLAEVLSTGLFDRDRELIRPLPFFADISARNGDRLVHVFWGSILAPEGSDPVETIATPEDARALERLDTRIEDLASWLPASAWEDAEIRPFVPSRYSFCLETGRDVDLARVLASLPRQAEDMIRDWDLAYREDSNPDLPEPWYLWCSAVTTERARALAEILDDAGVSSNGGDVFGLVYDSGRRNGSGLNVSISFGPLLPHDP